MRGIDYWKLADHYSIVQAAILTCGVDPQDLQYSVERNSDNRPEGYVALRTAILNAVRSGQLKAETLSFELDDYGNQLGIDLHSTLIAAEDLDAYLRARGITCEIFDRSGLAETGHSSPNQPPFPIKLNAALKAWAAVISDPASLRGKSPKQALAKWLTEHAGELGLLNKDGKANTTGIEEICKVANWKPSGGATPTPGLQSATHRPAPQRLPVPILPALARPRESFAPEIDDEIPF